WCRVDWREARDVLDGGEELLLQGLGVAVGEIVRMDGALGIDGGRNGDGREEIRGHDREGGVVYRRAVAREGHVREAHRMRPGRGGVVGVDDLRGVNLALVLR